MITYQKLADRRDQILDAACKLASQTHYTRVRRHHLAATCGTVPGNISRAMGSMDELREKVIKHALSNDIFPIIAQAIIDKHPAVAHLDSAERARVLSAVV